MKTMGRFLGLGALTTLIDYAVYSVLVWSGVDYVIAIVAGYGLGLWVNFSLGRRFVFTRGTKIAHTHRELSAVALIAVGGVLINVGMVKLLSYSLMQIDPLLSRVAGIAVAFFWNYFARKWWVYR